MPIPNSIADLSPEVAAWRRDLHANPELGYEEVRTSKLVAEKLREFGFDDVVVEIGKTGVVGVLHGKAGPGSGEAEAVMLRADMDALPIHEETDVAHASTRPGVMHACGHDGHTAMLLGAARHLADTRNFHGTAYFCFQPAEEGGAGAAAMIKDGLFTRFPCRAAFGMHNWPGLPTGAFGIRPGPFFARADEFRIELTGRGSHAAQPNLAHDPVMAAVHIAQALQTVVSRNIDPLQPAVVSVTNIHAGEAFNVIPETAMLGGTIRCFDDAVFDQIFNRIEEIAKQVAGGLGVRAVAEVPRRGYPPTVNDAEQATFVGEVAAEISESVHHEYPMTMGGEDFSFMAREKPSAFILVGSGEDHAKLHTAGYDFNDEVIPSGIAYWTRLVERALPAAV